MKEKDFINAIKDAAEKTRGLDNGTLALAFIEAALYSNDYSTNQKLNISQEDAIRYLKNNYPILMTGESHEASIDEINLNADYLMAELFVRPFSLDASEAIEAIDNILDGTDIRKRRIRKRSLSEEEREALETFKNQIEDGLNKGTGPLGSLKDAIFKDVPVFRTFLHPTENFGEEVPSTNKIAEEILLNYLLKYHGKGSLNPRDSKVLSSEGFSVVVNGAAQNAYLHNNQIKHDLFQLMLDYKRRIICIDDPFDKEYDDRQSHMNRMINSIVFNNSAAQKLYEENWEKNFKEKTFQVHLGGVHTSLLSADVGPSLVNTLGDKAVTIFCIPAQGDFKAGDVLLGNGVSSHVVFVVPPDSKNPKYNKKRKITTEYLEEHDIPDSYDELTGKIMAYIQENGVDMTSPNSVRQAYEVIAQKINQQMAKHPITNEMFDKKR